MQPRRLKAYWKVGRKAKPSMCPEAVRAAYRMAAPKRDRRISFSGEHVWCQYLALSEDYTLFGSSFFKLPVTLTKTPIQLAASQRVQL